MLTGKVLPPLPDFDSPGPPQLFELSGHELAIVHAERDQLLPERIAAALTGYAAPPLIWVRLDRLDRHPRFLADSIGAAATIGNSRRRAWSDAAATGNRRVALEETGRQLAESAPDGSAVVLEYVTGRGVVEAALRVLDAYTAHSRSTNGPGVLLAHRRLADGRLPRGAHVLGPTKLSSENDPRPEALQRAVTHLEVPVVARLLDLASGDPVAVHDVIDSLSDDRIPSITEAIMACRRRRSFRSRVTLQVLPRCTPAEIRLLRTATETGYCRVEPWQDVDTATLRPWLIPLSGGWFWLRPLWQGALEKGLARLRGLPDDDTFDRTPPPPKLPAVASIHRDTPVAMLTSTTFGVDPPASGDVRDTSEEALEPQKHTMDVWMLGSFGLSIDNETIGPLNGSLGERVLKYLLARESHAASRDVLLETFWPEVDPNKARNRLHVAVSGLRRILKATATADIVLFTNGSYRINEDLMVRSDVDQFWSATERARVSRVEGDAAGALSHYLAAIDTYRGDFLADHPYEEWTIMPREALRSAHLEVLDDALSLLDSLDRGDEATPIALKMLEQDPCSERAHRVLMYQYARQGREHQAIRQFELCHNVLHKHLARGPSPETIQAYLSIRQGEPTRG